MVPLSGALSGASFPTHPHDAAPLYHRRRRRRHPHVVEYLRRDIYPPICKVVTPRIHSHFNLKFTSDSAYLFLLFYRLFYLFFKSVRCVLRIFRLIVVAKILSLIVFISRYFDSYYVIIDFDDFESEFSSLRILSIYFENYLTCFNCCEC